MRRILQIIIRLTIQNKNEHNYIMLVKKKKKKQCILYESKLVRFEYNINYIIIYINILLSLRSMHLFYTRIISSKLKIL